MNINKVMQHDAFFWWDLAAWDRKSGAIKGVQVNIIRTVVLYAAEGLKKNTFREAVQTLRYCHRDS